MVGKEYDNVDGNEEDYFDAENEDEMMMMMRRLMK